MQVLDVFLRRPGGVPAFRCDFGFCWCAPPFGTNPNAHLIGSLRVLACLAAERWGRIGVPAVSLGMDNKCARASQPNCLL